MPRKPKAERRRVNGFLIYENGETCAGCDECMPAGRGCACPDCEAEDT